MAGPHRRVGLVSCAPALPERLMDRLASVRSKWALGSERGKGQCETAGSEGKAHSRGQSSQWLLPAPVYGPGGKICPRGHVLMAALGWLFFFLKRINLLRTLSGGQRKCSLSLSLGLRGQRSMDCPTRCLPPLLSPCGSLENQT